MDEFGIIARYFAPLAGEGAFGLTDDAALVAVPEGMELVVTTDCVSEGVDFFAFDPPAAIAQKALRVNLSDLAAKGAVPSGYLLNLTLPTSTTEDWLAAFAQGLAADQRTFGLALLGGDMGATDGPLSIAITAFGLVPKGGMVRRNGARVGDHVYVTGTIGESGAGLALYRQESPALSRADQEVLVARYRLPQPPVAFAAALRGIAHAAIDVSDGLMADLGHVAKASGVRVVVEGEHVPLSAPVRALWGENAVKHAVTAGDDYQIAFTGAPGLEGPFTPIGRVTEGAGAVLTWKGREVLLSQPGYRHF